MQLAAPAVRPRAGGGQRAVAALPGPGRGAPAVRLPRGAEALRRLRRPRLSLLEAGAGRAAQEAAALPGPCAAESPPVRGQEGPRRGASPGAPRVPARRPYCGGLPGGSQAPGQEPGAAPRASDRPRRKGPASSEHTLQTEAL